MIIGEVFYLTKTENLLNLISLIRNNRIDDRKIGKALITGKIVYESYFFKTLSIGEISHETEIPEILIEDFIKLCETSKKKIKKERVQSFIYFIQAENGLIKIGYTRNLKERLDILRSMSHSKLTLLLVLKGDRKKESRMHEIFQDYRVHGEWFKPEKYLIEYIEEMENSG